MFTIYKIENLINNKKYIGYTENYKSRMSQHISGLKNNRHENRLLQNDVTLYGIDAFTFVAIACATNKYDAKRLEHLIILEFGTLHRDYGYNKSTYLGWSPEGKLRDCERKLLRKRYRYELLPGVDLDDPINMCLVCTFKPN